MNERDVFDAAREIPDSASRDSFIRKACGEDHSLLERVRCLLAADDRAGTFLEESPIASGVDQSASLATSAENFPMQLLGMLSPSTRADSLGLLGHYQILKELGQGAFGTVYMAFDEKLHRLVAIKMLSREMAMTSPPRKRFLREARASAAIKHENVVQVYGVEELPCPYIVMEYIDGMTLQERMNIAGPLETAEVLRHGRQMASGLAAAHAAGLIHRDIKPGNILIESGIEQKIKITDFGLARTADDASLTQSGAILGTPLYMSPEQALGGTLDQRSDLFSLGCVLYAMAAGHPPFRASSTLAVLRRVTEDHPRNLSEIIPEIPTWLTSIIERLLQKKPDERLQTAKEVADLLARYESQLHGGMALPSGDHPIQGTHRPLEIVMHRDRKPLVIAGALVLIAAVVIGVWKFIPTLPASRVRESRQSTLGTTFELVTDLPKIQEPIGKTSSGTVKTTAQAERELAEWLLMKPGLSLMLMNQEGGWIEPALKNGDRLPEGIFTVGRITFTEADELTDADLAHIGTATGLTVLEIGNKGESLQHVTGKGISALLTPSVRKTLQTMTVYSRLPHVTDEDLLLFENSPAIRGLQFYFGMSGRETFLSRFAARGMKLNNLVLADSGPNRPLPSSWLMSVPDHSPEITALQIANCALTIPDVQSLHRLPQMQTLTLIACGLDDEVFNAIAEMTNLLKLELNGMSYNPHPGITDRGAVRIAEFKSLWHLSFAHTNVGDDTCAAIESLTNLKTLSLGATRVTDKGVSRLCALPVLSSVQLSSCPGISDESLYSLAQIKSLKMLWISSNPQLTEPALRKLQGALPDCKIVCDFPLATELGNK